MLIALCSGSVCNVFAFFELCTNSGPVAAGDTLRCHMRNKTERNVMSRGKRSSVRSEPPKTQLTSEGQLRGISSNIANKNYHRRHREQRQVVECSRISDRSYSGPWSGCTGALWARYKGVHLSSLKIHCSKAPRHGEKPDPARMRCKTAAGTHSYFKFWRCLVTSKTAPA